jgi:hypothetical protein
MGVDVTLEALMTCPPHVQDPRSEGRGTQKLPPQRLVDMNFELGKVEGLKVVMAIQQSTRHYTKMAHSAGAPPEGEPK